MTVGWFSLELGNEWIITVRVRPIIEALYQQ